MIAKIARSTFAADVGLISFGNLALKICACTPDPKTHPKYIFGFALYSISSASFSRFAVDGQWTFDPDLPALKNDAGHYSNMIKVKLPANDKDLQVTDIFKVT